MLQARDGLSVQLAGAYQPRKNDTCAAKFVDGQWYRAKVEKVQGPDVAVLYIDYGNRAIVPKTKVIVPRI